MDSENVIFVESNALGGLAAMNGGMWHHMPADYGANKPPNGDAHFDAAVSGPAHLRKHLRRAPHMPTTTHPRTALWSHQRPQ